MGRIGRVVRRLLGGAGLGLLAAAGAAQEAVPLTAAGSAVQDRWRGIEVTLELGGVVPWRIFTLDEPRRLVVELRGVAWQGAGPGALLLGDNATEVAFGPAREGWSRLVVGLGRPMEVTVAGLAAEGEGARLRLVLEATSAEAFAAAAGAPALDGAPEPVPPAPAAVGAPPGDGRLVVAIDPGHGGVDPGAERAGLRESRLMLALGLELAAALERAGMVPALTRSEDVFVPLQERMTRARAAGADVLVSLHADALEEDAATGASIYTLTREAVDGASARMVQRHEGGDLIAGLDLRGQDEAVAMALMDLARQGTAPGSERLARALAEELGRAGAALNTRPLRQANLAVLAAADFPSVLLEAGFLSDPGDRARLSDPAGRAPVVAAVLAALRAWAKEEEARGGLSRR